ncbi:serine hydrolase domain-containing protein [Aquimarina muelleri]|uniref:serine hydrolase domain-containing protein n=1 Tax=Aquimarina muelleri TaxID=279356 RepID=UPI003F68581E
MKQILRITLFLTLLINFGCGEKKNNPNTKNEEQAVDDYSVEIDSLIQTTNPRKFNGVISITQNGNIKYSKEYGYSDFGKKTPISLNDNFRIQSNSKQITAVLILKEVEKGNINLKSPIKEYFPNLKSTWADSVTVHQLLNMSSGIVGIDEPLLFRPGTEYKYSNPSYTLLGRIVKNVTGKEYAEVANTLFEKLKMNNTYCFNSDIIEKTPINGYNITNKEYALMEFNDPGFTKEWWIDFVPAGGIISNINDLNKWESNLHNGKILKPESYQLMTKYDIKGQHNAFGEKKIGYGYGVRIDDSNPIKTIGHAGRGLGFVSMKFHIQKTNVNVIILENLHSDDNNSVYYFENEIRKIVLKSKLAKTLFH